MFELFLQMKDANIAAEFFRNYSFFERVMKTLLRRMGLMSSEPDHLGPQASAKTQIAVTCEVRSGLEGLSHVVVGHRHHRAPKASFSNLTFGLWVPSGHQPPADLDLIPPKKPAGLRCSISAGLFLHLGEG